MSIMDEYARPEKEYYQWHVDNACGYLLELDEELWKKGIRELHILREL